MSRSPDPFSDIDLDTVRAALTDSGVIGIWTHDVWADRLVLPPALVRLMGFDPAQDAHGVSLTDFLARTQGEDRARVENALHAAVARGGPFEIAFHTPADDAAADLRWIVLRGRMERDATGEAARGRGIAIDLTEEQAGAVGDGRRAVNRMAEHAIAMRGLVAALQRPVLAKLLDGLMLEIGFELARHLHDSEPAPPH